jgi:hypothetical protein
MLAGITLASLALAAPVRPAEIEAVIAHPPMDGFFTCSEHWNGQLQTLGDALGRDCMIERLVTESGRTWTRPYATDGMTNEDWFSWGVAVLSPCDCVVLKVYENPVQNSPGVLGKPPASHLVLRRDDGVYFLLAHTQLASVTVGQRVAYGEPIAKVGNNGFGRSPHVHMGAWKDDQPLQIRWDQTRMQTPPEYRKPSST